MKAVALTIAGAFSILIGVTFIPYPPAMDAARLAGFTEADIEIGLQYGFERRLFSWGSTVLELVLLTVLALTPLGRRLADRFLGLTGQRRVLAVLGVGLTYWLVHAIVYVPIGIARLNHSWAWGMSNLDFADWLRDYMLHTAINTIIEAIVLAGFYMLLLWLPRTWWLLAPAGGSMLAIAYAFFAPLVINPLFNDFTPLEKTKWADQKPRMEALIKKAEVPVQEILVMNGSRQSNHTNAYFTGFGPTRRIVLYDTLLKNHDADQVESVLGHELGHWQHDHINKGILLGLLGALVGCYMLHRFLLAARDRAPWNLQTLADPAGVPLVLLLTFLGGWFVMPMGNLVSRHFERQADQSALELADVPKAFIAAEIEMARANKSNVAPSPWNVWLFSSHPPTIERIRMAEEWREMKRR